MGGREGRCCTKLAGGDSSKQHLGKRLRRLLIFDSKKGRNGNEILRGGAGYYLVDDHSKIVGVLEMRAFVLGITLSQK